MITLKDAQHNLKHRIPFNAGNLTAIDNAGSYEVYSYQTVIAWCPSFGATAEDSTVTDTKYSVTTSKHANIVRRAWGLL